MFRYFTIKSANEALPSVIEKFNNLKKQKNEIMKAEQELQSSVSNFEEYQSNRLKLRYRDKNEKTQLCHTLNGSALALPRVFAALIENNQTPEGIKIPKVLQSYTGFDIIS